MSYLDKLKDEEYIKIASENKKGTFTFHGVFSTNWRNHQSFKNKFKSLLDASNNRGTIWYQKNGQPKFKEHRKLFSSTFHFFKVDEKNVFRITNEGIQAISMTSENFGNMCIDGLEIKNCDIMRFNKNLNSLNSYTNSNLLKMLKVNSQKALTILNFLGDQDFVDFINMGGDWEEVYLAAKKLGIFEKFKNGIYPIATLKSFLEQSIRRKNGDFYKFERKKRIFISEVKTILRDQNEVRKVNYRSDSKCEICKNDKMQFRKMDNALYNQVHHLLPLGSIEESDISKYDKKEFMISLCPFHHMEIHHGKMQEAIITKSLEALKNIYPSVKYPKIEYILKFY